MPVMQRLLLGLLIITACGTSDSEPTIPYTGEVIGELINFTALIDTATTDQVPNNIEDRTTLAAGDYTFSWSTVDGADEYVLIPNDASEVGPEAPNASFSAYARSWTDEPSTVAHLEATNETGVRLVVLVQVLAYDGSEIIGSSWFWAILIDQV